MGEENHHLCAFFFPNSHMCDKGVGLELFPSDSLESLSYDFDEITHMKPFQIAHIKPSYGVERLHKSPFKS